MKALVLGPHGLRFDAAYREPRPADDEAVIRVTKAGICGTDLELVRGYKGFHGVPGHEFVGVVESSVSRPDLVGKRVVGEINAYCGHCRRCDSGRRQHCETRTVLGILGRDGAFAERLTLPAANLYVLPDSISDDDAVFVEPLAAACRVAQQIRDLPDARVAVLGRGRLGILVAQALLAEDFDVTAVGRHDDAKGRFDVVVDATGSPEGFARAQDLVRPLGTIVLKSTCAEATVPVDLTRIVVDEVKVIGSRCGPFSDAIRLLERRAVDVQPLISARYPVREGVAAFEHAARPGTLKVLLHLT